MVSPYSRRPGRPRSRQSQRIDADLAAEILDAAAELFVDRGFGATTTRAIAERVGVTQAAMYYHYRSKEDLLSELLTRVIAPAIEAGRALQARADPASLCLSMLIWSDVHELMKPRHNIGSLFLLPEVRLPRFAPFREQRRLLRSVYADLVGRCIEEDALPDLPQLSSSSLLETRSILVDAVFGLVESVITIRADRPDADPITVATGLRASALRLVGYDGTAIEAITTAASRATARNASVQ
ncbi:MAG TPA: helix-turn-helix domain-containing protein [Pseudolysinimonas sp.]|nr:helix-turn-helix domain-containing protein [Pseudolysinimonas sp.]